MNLVLVDGKNLVYRAHFAHASLIGLAGEPTGCLYGFFRILRKLRKMGKVIVCWDNGVPGKEQGTNWRKLLYPAYKANRTENEAARIATPQMVEIAEMLAVLDISQVGVPGLEADDLIGLASAKWRGSVVIYSNDKDMFQLLEQGRVKVLRPIRKFGHDLQLNAQALKRQTGISPSRWADYLACGGDTSDGIRLLPGYGPIKAARLVQDGVRASLPWKRQTIALKRRYASLEPIWERVQLAYSLTHIPRRFGDSRITALLNGFNGMSDLCSRNRTEVSPKVRMRLFMEFCSKHALAEFMAQRKEFVC